jgi:hypothetical protein
MWKAWVTPYDLSISALHFTPRAPLGNAGTDWVGPKSTRVIPNPTRFAEKTRSPSHRQERIITQPQPAVKPFPVTRTRSSIFFVFAPRRPLGATWPALSFLPSHSLDVFADCRTQPLLIVTLSRGCSGRTVGEARREKACPGGVFENENLKGVLPKSD